MSNLNKENFLLLILILSDEVDIAKFHFNISPRTNILNIKNNVQFVENFEDPAQKNLLLQALLVWLGVKLY